jgi:uncharacterized membrane protein
VNQRGRPVPAKTIYHRILGWHAPELRRAVVVLAIGLAVAGGLSSFAPWPLAAVGGWDAAAFIFVIVVWHLTAPATGTDTERLANRPDHTIGSATVVLLTLSTVSLVGAGSALHMASHRSGAERGWLITFAAATVALSWTMLNTIYMVRYAHLYYMPAAPAVVFGDPESPEKPNYRDFAYLSFTIGMTYQVSDTSLRNRSTRNTVLTHAVLAYVFGVVILAGAVNVTASLLS